MTELYLAFGLLTALSVAAIALPLLRRPGAAATRAEYDMRVYKDQLSEIDRDLDRGLASPEQAEAARTEVKRRMLGADSEMRAKPRSADNGRRTRLFVVIALIVLMPAASLGLYFGSLGSPTLPDHPWITAQSKRLGVSEAQITVMRQQATALEERTAVEPRNQAVWLELGDLGMQLRQFDNAVSAYDQAMRLGEMDGESWANFGEAIVQANGNQVTEGAKEAFVRALRLDRTAPAARWYLATAALQAERPAEAIAILRDLSASADDSAPWKSVVRQRIGSIAQQAGIMPVSVAPAHPLDIIDGKVTVTVDGTAVPAEGADMRAQADARRAPGQGFSDDERAMITSMIDGLKARLAENPADFAGWMRLGKSLTVLGDPAGAADAYKNAVAQNPDDMDARFNYATTLMAQAEAEKAEALPEAFFETVTVMQDKAPDKADTLYLSGLVAKVKGDEAAARAAWTKLLGMIPEGTPAHNAMKSQIDGLGS